MKGDVQMIAAVFGGTLWVLIWLLEYVLKAAAVIRKAAALKHD